MNVKATLELAETRLVWPQTTRVVSTLENAGEEAIEHVNVGNERASAALGLTDVETGHARRLAQAPPPGVFYGDVTLAPGERLTEAFRLSRRVPLPGPGLYSLRAHHTWEGGGVDSIPVRFEVVAASPRALDLATTTGGPAGDVRCAWVNAGPKASSLWLSLVDTSSAAFSSSTRLAEVPADAAPVLSAPPLGPSVQQYVAWIAGASLAYAVHREGQVTPGAIPLDGPGYAIVPPLLEAPFDPKGRPSAEAVLLREAPGGFHVRVARLDGPGALGEPVLVEGPVPRWARTAYRADASRCTVFLAPRRLRAGEPAISVSVAAWRSGRPVEVVANWPGVLLAADQRLAGDGTAIGVALLDMHAGEGGPRYALQRWRVTPDDRFEEGTLTRIAWGRDEPAARVVFRIDSLGGVCALLEGKESGAWLRADGAGHVAPLACLPEPGAVPRDVFFVDWTEPAILYDDPRAGLRIATAAPRRPVLSPAGIQA
jgi:hypothetical protein